jgi:hypothetical protein
MDTTKIQAVGTLTLAIPMSIALVHVDSSVLGSLGHDSASRAPTFDTDQTTAPKCAEPPIVKRNLNPEETRKLLMQITQDLNSARGELFLPMFLDTHDLPNNVRMTQDTRSYLPLAPEDNAVFARHCGYHSGLALWEGGFDQTIWRLVDIRWVFPTAAEARAFHKATTQANSEGQPRISDAPTVGTDCAVFGGTANLSGTPLTHYYYLFYVQNVAVKLYVAQGPDVVGDKRLTPAKVADFAKICVKRIQDYNQAAAADSRQSGSSPRR